MQKIKSAELKKKLKKLKEFQKRIKIKEKMLKKDMATLKNLGIAALALGATLTTLYGRELRKTRERKKIFNPFI
jgi:hypothetical protein